MQEEIDKFVPEETIEGSIVAIEWFKRYLYPVTPYSSMLLYCEMHNYCFNNKYPYYSAKINSGC